MAQLAVAHPVGRLARKLIQPAMHFFKGLAQRGYRFSAVFCKRRHKLTERSEFQSLGRAKNRLADDPRIRSGAVLLDHIIREYVFTYNLLIEKNTLETGKLKGGNYTMTPAGDEAWRFVPNERTGQHDVKITNKSLG
jgi:hypothetical protein